MIRGRSCAVYGALGAAEVADPPVQSRRSAEAELRRGNSDMLMRSSPNHGLTLSAKIPGVQSAFVHVHLDDANIAHLSVAAPYNYRRQLEGKAFSDLSQLQRAVTGAAKRAAVLPSLLSGDPIVPEINLSQRLRWRPHGSIGSSFTDPHHHRAEKFQYLIKGVTLCGDYERFLDDPGSVREQLNSCSIINQDFQNVVFSASSGFILKAPADAYYAAGPGDLYLQNSIVRSTTGELATYLNEVYQRVALPSPAKVLKDSRKSLSIYNEVAVMGTTARGAPVTIDGVFLISGSQDSVSERVRAYAALHRLPIVILAARA